MIEADTPKPVPFDAVAAHPFSPILPNTASRTCSETGVHAISGMHVRKNINPDAESTIVGAYRPRKAYTASFQAFGTNA